MKNFKVRTNRGNISIDAFCAGQAPYGFIEADCEEALKAIPSGSVDMVITSPPYWNQRAYDGSSVLGAEKEPREYVEKLTRIFRETKRVLRDGGSLWLNLGDTYKDKNLLGIPWRVAFSLQDDGWILRNDIVWDKSKGNPCNSKDKLRNVHEYLFHFVLKKQYYYDVDAIRNPPEEPYYKDGKIVSPTGVSGVRYEQQIRNSTELTDIEKRNALRALRETLLKLETGELNDFRMIIRGTQRFTHSDSPEYSGRAKELIDRGYCILPYHPKGTKPGDVWRIIPEDTHRKDKHYAVFPTELCELPIRASSRENGIVLDPFAGTGTAIVCAVQLGRRGLGIDISNTYINEAEHRARNVLNALNIQERLWG